MGNRAKRRAHTEHSRGGSARWPLKWTSFEWYGECWLEAQQLWSTKWVGARAYCAGECVCVCAIFFSLNQTNWIHIVYIHVLCLLWLGERLILKNYANHEFMNNFPGYLYICIWVCVCVGEYVCVCRDFIEVENVFSVQKSQTTTQYGNSHMAFQTTQREISSVWMMYRLHSPTRAGDMHRIDNGVDSKSIWPIVL